VKHVQWQCALNSTSKFFYRGFIVPLLYFIHDILQITFSSLACLALQQIYCCLLFTILCLSTLSLLLCNSILYKSASNPRRVGRASCRLILQEGAPIDDVKDEEREGEEESGNLVNVNGDGPSLAAFIVLNRQRLHWTSASIESRPHRRLSMKSNQKMKNS